MIDQRLVTFAFQSDLHYSKIYENIVHPLKKCIGLSN